MLCRPVTHELSTVVETRGGRSHGCWPAALGPAPPRCPRVCAEERWELGTSPPLTLARFQRHQLHLAWTMAVAGSTAFRARPGAGLHPGGEGWTCTWHTGSHLSCPSPPESPRGLCAPSAQNPPENGPLFVVHRKDGMRTTLIKSHVIY